MATLAIDTPDQASLEAALLRFQEIRKTNPDATIEHVQSNGVTVAVQITYPDA
jgi:hypothetical protein